MVSSSCLGAKISRTKVRRSNDSDSRFSDLLDDIVLVLATGSKWTGPIDYPENDSDIRQFISQWQERFESAEDVVIVGGGAVGLGTY